MKTKINNKLIRSFDPCYDPSEIGIPDNETLSVKKWINKYRSQVQDQADILWLICRNEFMTDKDLRLFAVWCAREALKLQDNPDQRSINACDIAERYANGAATNEELESAESAAQSAAWSAQSAARSAAESAWSAVWSAVWSAAWSAQSASRSAAESASRSAVRSAAESAQIDQLITYFK